MNNERIDELLAQARREEPVPATEFRSPEEFKQIFFRITYADKTAEGKSRNDITFIVPNRRGDTTSIFRGFPVLLRLPFPNSFFLYMINP